jgi:murein L,D-transpeptidase YafK/tetratricopeptide (TPR) repeat protein
MHFNLTSAPFTLCLTVPTFHTVGLFAALQRLGGGVLIMVAVVMLLCSPTPSVAQTNDIGRAASTVGGSDQRFHQAVMLAEQQRHDAALVIFEELADQPKVPLEVLNNMAVIYAQQGRYALARSIFEQALRHDPVYAAVYDNLQTVHGLLARQAYARALVLEGSASAQPVSMNLIRAWTPPSPLTASKTPENSAPSAETPMLPVTMGSQTDPSPPPALTAPTTASAPESFTRSPTPPARPLHAVMKMQAAFGLVTPRSEVVTVVLVIIFVLIAATAATAAIRTVSGNGRNNTPPEAASSTSNASVSTAPGSIGGGESVAAEDNPILPLSAPEARLIEIYRLIGQARIREALGRAETLVRDLPHFHLGQLIYGDLLMAQTARLSPDGQIHRPVSPNNSSTEALAQLELEAARRIQALRETPPLGTIPRQLLLIAPKVRFVVVIDASRSRLYLLENKANGLTLVSHRYVSIGRNGVDKWTEGDQRTPLGVYDITEKISADKLTDLYGAGALPINFPNEYDQRVGRSGRGIWLHGVPKADYVRAPQSSNGCIVLANDDMRQILRDLVPMNTPVVVAEHLEWIQPSALDSARSNAIQLLGHWNELRHSNDTQPLINLYSKQFWNGSEDFNAMKEKLNRDNHRQTMAMKDRGLTDVSVIAWRDRYEILVITFTETNPISAEKNKKSIKRQYWVLEGGQWKIFYEGIIA